MENITDITLCATQLQWSILPLLNATPNLESIKIKSSHDTIKECLEALNDWVPAKVNKLTIQLGHQDRKGMDIGLFDRDFWQETFTKKSITLHILDEKLTCCPYHACCIEHCKKNVDYLHLWKNFYELLDQ